MEEAFASATTLEEIFKAFEDMASAFDQDDFFLDFLKASLEVDEESEELEHEKDLCVRLLDFGNRALEILVNGNIKAPLPVAMTLHVMGTASFNLQRFNESLGYLYRAHTILTKLEEEGVNVDNVRHVLYALVHVLSKTNTVMGRSEEAIRNNIKALELQLKALGQESMEAGTMNRKVAEKYVILTKFNDALPFCLKAIEIHTSQEGNNPVAAAYARRLLGLIYTGLEEHAKAKEQTEISSKILEDHPNHHTDHLGELNASVTQIRFGKYDEALITLHNILWQKDLGDETAVFVCICKARALCHKQKNFESKEHLEMACRDLDRTDSCSSMFIFHAYMEISVLYERMKEFESAISPLERYVTMLEKIPQQRLIPNWSRVSARIGRLFVLTDKATQAIPYFESALEILLECFGPKHIEVGYVYNNLGAAYLELGKPQNAEQMFSDARDIIVESLGPHHANSIIACQNLSKASDAMASCSYKPETETQQAANEAWESHGPSTKDEVGEAGRFLEPSLSQGTCAEDDDDDDDDGHKEAQRALEQVSLDRVPPTTPTKALLLPRISELACIEDPSDY